MTRNLDGCVLHPYLGHVRRMLTVDPLSDIVSTGLLHANFLESSAWTCWHLQDWKGFDCFLDISALHHSEARLNCIAARADFLQDRLPRVSWLRISTPDSHFIEYLSDLGIIITFQLSSSLHQMSSMGDSPFYDAYRIRRVRTQGCTDHLSLITEYIF